jgi:hypothetical protein
MQSFAEWLREIGLQRYAAAFAEHRIDFDVVRDLSAVLRFGGFDRAVALDPEDYRELVTARRREASR